MEPEHKAALRAHRSYLSGELLVSDTIVPFLYQEDVLTDSQVELIESQPTNRQKSLKLLDILPNRGPRAFSAFLRSLEDYSWVRDLLQQQTWTGFPGGRSSRTKFLDDVGQMLVHIPIRRPSGATPHRPSHTQNHSRTKPGCPGPPLTSVSPEGADLFDCRDVCRLPDSVLLRVPSDQELSRLASRLGSEWELVLMDLGLSTEALFRCRSDHPFSTHGAVLAGLVQWRRSEGREATVQRLMQSLEAADVHVSALTEILESRRRSGTSLVKSK
ncbi:death domain-containing protein CRADD isoform X1 [Betta splendens]|uniref:Death domain-containing protein CRADD isoform X1 n=1 Tax=Betta splendens TaxID=158456 RepID=A0A9W2Y0N5_BETSP|nr:death domain-containing protein CRADD isoform X1 [Betta splendens]